MQNILKMAFKIKRGGGLEGMLLQEFMTSETAFGGFKGHNIFIHECKNTTLLILLVIYGMEGGVSQKGIPFSPAHPMEWRLDQAG